MECRPTTENTKIDKPKTKDLFLSTLTEEGYWKPLESQKRIKFKKIAFMTLFAFWVLLLFWGGTETGVHGIPWSIKPRSVVESFVGAGLSAQAAEGEAAKPAAVPKDFKHARFGLKCSDCHEPDQPVIRPTTAKCLQCHGSYQDVAALTQKVFPNPHSSHVGEVKCNQCHMEHQNSVLYCNQCHVFEMKVP